MGKKVAVIAAFIGVLSFCYFWYFRVKEPVEKFSLIQVSGFGTGDIPYFEVEISGIGCTFGLDLGLDAEFSAAKKLVDKIENKSFVKTVSMQGMRGNVYNEKVYQIPSIKLGTATFHHPLLNEEDALWEEESKLIEFKNTRAFNPVGTIGWRSFKKVTVFLDLKNNNIILARSTEDLPKKYSLQGFTKAPFFLDRNFIEVDAQVFNESLRCVIDTGSTFNLIHTENPNDEPLEKLIVDESRFVKVDRLEIGGKNCGPVTLRPIPIKFHVPVEAILGMEFLLNHQVFIDFPNQEIYFSEAQ